MLVTLHAQNSKIIKTCNGSADSGREVSRADQLEVYSPLFAVTRTSPWFLETFSGPAPNPSTTFPGSSTVRLRCSPNSQSYRPILHHLASVRNWLSCERVSACHDLALQGQLRLKQDPHLRPPISRLQIFARFFLLDCVYFSCQFIYFGGIIKMNPLSAVLDMYIGKILVKTYRVWHK